jgi:hypothetical protein
LTASAQDDALIAGQNINMVSGTRWPDGDPFLQRQNEPSIAVSARNELNLLAGSNDYRTVDLPGLPKGKTIGDSWVSVYRSNTGGARWTSTLLPGYPQDTSELGQQSPLWLAGYEASADPVVRSGTHGLFYYSGIAFTRASLPPSAGFVATFMDLNNDERKSSIGYVRTTLFDQNTDGMSFIDKPWIAVDKPRSSALVATLDVYTDDGTVVQQTVECGNVYVAYARIQGDGTAAISSQIMFTRSSDCGATWTDPPKQVSLPNTINQGASVAIDPLSGNIIVAWRQFENATLNCTRQAAYWRENPEAWPVDQIELADTLATKDSSDTFLAQTDDGTESDLNDEESRPSDVFRELLAAWLNIFGGANSSAITQQLEEAENWLLENPLGSKPEKAAKRVGNELRKFLRDFNQGKLRPGSCDALASNETNTLLSGLNPNAIKVVKSTDGGNTFSVPVTASDVNYTPFEQGTTEYSFRTTGYPTMTFDGSGRAYIAYTTRGLAVPDNDLVGGDSRIAITTSNDGINWTPAYAIDEPQLPGHQFQPALTFTRGKVFLLYYDMREDVSGIFDRYIVDLPVDPTVLRHSTDVRVAQADPGDAPMFTDYTVLDVSPSTQASRYPFMLFGDGLAAASQQMQYNPPNLPMFKGGTVPFFGDYIDIAALPFVKDSNGLWQFDIDASVGAPVLHAVWTDNRDVIGPPDGDWTSYVPPAYDVDGDGIPDPVERSSIFNPAQTVAACDPTATGADPTVVYRTKMRNQNIYTSRLTQGLAAAIPGNNRPLGLIQRVFVGFVQNTADTDKLFRLEILNQPVGGIASFDQFAETPVTQIDEVIERQSSIARSIYVSSTDPAAAINIRVTELDTEGVPLSASMWINPDSSAPQPSADNILEEEIYTPAIFNPAIFNPAIFNPTLLGQDDIGIFTPAIFNSAEYGEFLMAALIQQALLNPAIFNPAIFNPAIFNPAIFNPAIFNPAIFNPAIFNPAIFNPAIFNVDVENPAIFNPAIFNPAIFNPAIFNTTLVETSMVVTNEGNATAAYSVNLDLENPPEGFLYQLVVFRTYLTPVAEGCELREQVVQEAIINELMPDMNGNLRDPDSTSFYVAPGDHVVVSVRILPDPDAPDPGDPSTIDTLEELQLSQSIVPQAVDTDGLANGATTPTPVIVYAPGTESVGMLARADWLAPGDGLLTVDSTTGLEWLDLTVTKSMTVAEVTAQLAPGGQFEGFSYASSDQVGEMFFDAGLQEYSTKPAPLGGYTYWDPLHRELVEVLQSLWGITGESPGVRLSRGAIGEKPPYSIGFERFEAALYIYDTGQVSTGLQWGPVLDLYDYVGHVLVRSPPVGTLAQADWHTPGDGLLTRDSATGLEWLDLTVTKNLSVAEVTPQLRKGGKFEGFYYASPVAVAALFTDAGLHDWAWDFGTVLGNADPLAVSKASGLQNLWGITSRLTDLKTSQGFLDDTPTGSPSTVNTQAVLYVEPSLSWAGGARGTSASGASNQWGHALVRTDPLPPASIGTISEADWRVPGDNLIAIDSATGLEWLDLTVTANMSYWDVIRECGTGGLFDGFRFATAAEVEEMFTNAGLNGFGNAASGTIQGNTNAGLQDVAENLQGILGLTCISELPTCTYDSSSGYIGSSNSGQYFYAVLNVSPPGWGAGTKGAWTTDGSARQDLGSMLVRP